MGEKIIQICPDDCGISLDRDSNAKKVAISAAAIIGEEMRLFCPGCAGSSKYVGGALIGISKDVIRVRTHHDGVAIDRNSPAKLITGRTIAGEELRLLDPRVTGADKDVNRPLMNFPADGVVGRAYHCSVATDGNGASELIKSSAVSGDQLLLLNK